MKKLFCIAFVFLAGFLPETHVFADIDVNFFGNNNFTIDADTTFAADLNDGSTGLLTDVGIGLWFEFTPYADRNINPQRDVVSVSLKLANSAFYAWRGYDLSGPAMHDGDQTPSDVTSDQAKSIWFDTFVAQLEYNQWWVRVAGIEPEISVSQASIRSVFDPIFVNRTDVSKNNLPLPLFNTGSIHYNGNGGIISLINRDIVHLNRREVVVAGHISAGMKSETLDFDIKGGSWLKAGENELNAWVGGGDLAWRPDLSQLVNFSFLAAVNYDTVEMDAADPMADPDSLKENPLAFGLGYEYRFNLPNRMVMKPYAGFDFLYETQSNEWNMEFGGGLQWFFRGTGAEFKRNTKIGGMQIGDVDVPVGLVAGMNVDKNGFMNAIISFNEDPRSSPLRNFGGFMELEMMNITGKNYTSFDGEDYNDFLVAAIVQLEYLLWDNKLMPYVFMRYLPGDISGTTPVYSKDLTSITSKLGCRFTPFKYFSIDLWYERTDVRDGKDWTADNGLISVTFSVWNYN